MDKELAKQLKKIEMFHLASLQLSKEMLIELRKLNREVLTSHQLEE